MRGPPAGAFFGDLARFLLRERLDAELAQHRSGIAVGAPVSGSEPLETFGNATTCRISGSPAISATNRSRPIAKPPCGGAPISSASSRKPNFPFASSSLIPITRKTAACISERWIRIEPEPSSQPFQIRS